MAVTPEAIPSDERHNLFVIPYFFHTYYYYSSPSTVINSRLDERWTGCPAAFKRSQNFTTGTTNEHHRKRASKNDNHPRQPVSGIRH
jgi:hypothetical protein